MGSKIEKMRGSILSLYMTELNFDMSDASKP